MKLKSLSSLLICAFIYSCSTNNLKSESVSDEIIEKFNLFIENLEIVPKEGNYILILIPAEGCDYCINKTIKKVNERNFNPDVDVKIALTSFSRKKIYMKIDSLSIHNKNFYTDFKGKAFDLGLVGDFPVLFYIKNNELKNVFEINAPNSDQVLSLISE